MKVAILTSRERCEKYSDFSMLPEGTELVYIGQEYTARNVLEKAGDADCVLVDAVLPVTAEMIEGMPNLKMIHCEGVGFDRIDLEAARKRGIYVCNNAGCNAEAVAELAVMMMSMLLHRTIWGDRLVRSGKQGEAVRQLERVPTMDLRLATVGLVGFGAIAQATARLLRVFGCKVYYYARHRKDREVEEAYGVEYLPLEQLAEKSDIVSLHCPATAESHHMVNRTFLARMKPGAYLVNTARGAVIDDEALCEAIRSGRLAGAALDAYAPEPVTAEHPLVQLAEEFPDRLILCPHQGGLTQASFQNVYQLLFEDL